MKLSIIIPYYNTRVFTDELLRILKKQITQDVEVILIDDGSNEEYCPNYEWINVIRTNNNGQAKARNLGLNRATGDYIQFIDSDDLVADDFIKRLFEKMQDGNDLIEFSWKSTGSGTRFDYKISEGQRLTNPSVCTRCFKRSYIGKTRFSEKKDATEDEDFSRRLGYLTEPVTVSVISDYMYFYRTDAQGSNVKRYKQGLCKTKRIVYYFDKVDADRADILEAIKKDDEENEVFLLTNKCDLPELKRYCQILPSYVRIWTHFLKGEPFTNVEIIQTPFKAEIILYINFLARLGGIETFIYQFAKMMKNRDVALVCEKVPEEQERKLSQVVKVIAYQKDRTYLCDNLIMLRILDLKPKNIFYRNSVQMCHACKTSPIWIIPKNCEHIVTVSETSRESFGVNAKVIHNPIEVTKENALVLISATRIPAPDKGGNEWRMKRLAEMLNEAHIPFIWFNFSDNALEDAPQGFVNVGARDDIQPYLRRADYLVQLSESEAWSYSVLEALSNNVPVIVTPFKSAYEMGIEEGRNGHIVPFNMDFDVKTLLNVPRFKFNVKEYNKQIAEQWGEILKGDNE